ncbi:hypothetical protein R3P38DRAFT_2819811 [Favolaschia claudopus]|uniref:Uncharacterized protein n=1 Tax=Favolaschia claudopus TaxID=2862362 RepID=A0AAW0EDG6_9AGAR
MPRAKSNKKKQQQEKQKKHQQRSQSKKPAKYKSDIPSHAPQGLQVPQPPKPPLLSLPQVIIPAACTAVRGLSSVSDYPAASDATWDLITSQDGSKLLSLQKKGAGFLKYSLMEANFLLNDNFENGMVKAKEEIIEECILSEEVITEIVVRMQGYEEDDRLIEKHGPICRSAFHVLIGGLWTQYTANSTPVSSWISDVFTPLLVAANQAVKKNPTTTAPPTDPRRGITQEPLQPNSVLAVLHGLRNLEVRRPRRVRLKASPVVPAPSENSEDDSDDSGSDMMEVDVDPPSSPSKFVWPRPGRGKSLPWTPLPFEDISLPRHLPASE